MNQVIMIGRLTKDPELLTTTNGTEVANFSIAVQRSFAQKGKERETDFFDCTCYGQTAPFICHNFFKGKPIALTGSLRQRRYTDRDGKNHTTYAIIVERVEFVPRSDDKPQEKPQEPADFEEIEVGDLPF